MKKIDKTIRNTIARQDANFERFMQQKADVFQVTGAKEQAMFWVMSPMAR